MKVSELDVWDAGAPVVTAGDHEFSVWLDGAPVVDGPSEDDRRRAFYIN